MRYSTSTEVKVGVITEADRASTRLDLHLAP